MVPVAKVIERLTPDSRPPAGKRGEGKGGKGYVMAA